MAPATRRVRKFLGFWLSEIGFSVQPQQKFGVFRRGCPSRFPVFRPFQKQKTKQKKKRRNVFLGEFFRPQIANQGHFRNQVLESQVWEIAILLFTLFFFSLFVCFCCCCCGLKHPKFPFCRPRIKRHRSRTTTSISTLKIFGPFSFAQKKFRSFVAYFPLFSRSLIKFPAPRPFFK